MYWYDGNLIDSNLIELNINNPALLYGANIFTTMRVYGQSLTHPLTNWNYHGDRLKKAIIDFNWHHPDWESILKGCQQLISYFPVIRITILPDGKELILGRNLPEDLSKNQQEGIIGWVANKSYQRSLSGYKTGNYLGAWLALKDAQKLGAKEAILINKNDHWLETSTGNLWGYKRGIWFTPSLKNGILPGIMRRFILEKVDISIEENFWDLSFVKTLEAIAYSNCVVEFIPFKTIKTPEGNLNLDTNKNLFQKTKIDKNKL